MCTGTSEDSLFLALYVESECDMMPCLESSARTVLSLGSAPIMTRCVHYNTFYFFTQNNHAVACFLSTSLR
jgi:hypothetical protein